MINVPPLFPPYNHYFDADNLVGADDLRLAILQIRDTIAAMPERLLPILMTHLDDVDNPHRVDKEDVGLGFVDNFKTATVAETIEGMLNNRFVTPSGVRQLIASINTEPVASHTAVATDYELANNSAFATQAIIPVPVTGTTEVEVGKHYRVMAGANLIFPAEEGEIRIIIDHTVDVSTGSVVAVAPPNEVFHTSAGDDATVTLRDVGLEYIYQRINGAWRLS